MAAQNTGNAPPGPPIAYVSNGGGGITEINTANFRAPFENPHKLLMILVDEKGTEHRGLLVARVK